MGKFNLERPQLCLITDPEIPNLLERIDEALAAGITMLQLRGHQLSLDQFSQLAQILGPRCQRHGVTFIVNDRLDAGLAVHSDGFQLGIRSLPLAKARHLVGEDALLGMSIHSLEEAKEAITNGADFLFAGTIFASTHHPEGPEKGPALIHAIKHALPQSRLLAIGGITPANAQLVMEAGADGIAVISAILKAPNVAHSVQELRNVIGL